MCMWIDSGLTLLILFRDKNKSYSIKALAPLLNVFGLPSDITGCKFDHGIILLLSLVVVHILDTEMIWHGLHYQTPWEMMSWVIGSLQFLGLWSAWRLCAQVPVVVFGFLNMRLHNKDVSPCCQIPQSDEFLLNCRHMITVSGQCRTSWKHLIPSLEIQSVSGMVYHYFH